MIPATKNRRFYGTVKVGDRGQVVIPIKARKELGIQPGDILFVMTGPNRRAIIMVKADSLKKIAERIMKELEEPQENPEPQNF
jgi:AbrB family looped-hinge helix DNA binding protein